VRKTTTEQRSGQSERDLNLRPRENDPHILSVLLKGGQEVLMLVVNTRIPNISSEPKYTIPVLGQVALLCYIRRMEVSSQLPLPGAKMLQKCAHQLRYDCLFVCLHVTTRKPLKEF
jgi:hypothetical protein